MKKLVICALALGGFAASAHAADLNGGGLKDPLPDTLTFAGVTVYGTIDVGYGFDSNGAPTSGAAPSGDQYLMFGAKGNRQAISGLTDNALSQSQIGVKIEENIGAGFTAIGKLDTGFNPISGEIADGCAAMVRNNGKEPVAWTTGLDTSRCGQAFNGQAFVGVTSPTYGTLTIGRQQSLDQDLMGNYDPMGGSYALSLVGYSGTAGGGVGDTETARWDNSVKYLYQFGPVHAAGMYSSGGQDTAIHKDAYGANVGATYRGASIDAVYTKENGAISMAPIPAPAAGGTPIPTGNFLNATVTDNEAFTVGGKYVFDFGGGGFKDQGPGSKMTLFAGYQHTQMSNTTSPVQPGSTSIGGYQMFAVNNTPFAPGAHKTLQTEWAGAKYEMGPWAFTGAYYHISQDAYTAEVDKLPVQASALNCTKTAALAANAVKANCAGDANVVSGLVDYTFNKHFDMYAGVAWSDVNGGFFSGFATPTKNTETTVVTGMRLRF